MKALTSFFKDPLLHFLVMGFVLFLGLHIFGDNRDDRVIRVDRYSLLQFVQYRMKTFDAEEIQTYFDNLVQQEKDHLVEQYVREEALYREAQSLNLFENDYVIRRRLVSKVEYIAEGFFNDEAVVDADLEDYFHANVDTYRQPAIITFAHIFFANKKAGAMERSGATLDEVNRLGVEPSSAGQYGELFLYNRNYAEKTRELIQRHFGDEFTAEIFQLETGNQGVWVGPVESRHGFHLVSVLMRSEEYIPAFDAIRLRVEEDYVRDRKAEQLNTEIQNIVDAYEVDNRL